MLSPDGEEFPGQGCFLEVVENRKLVFTDTLTEGYRPSEKPFTTGIVTFESHGDGTKYTAIVKHKSIKDSKKHEKMGFKEG